MKNQGGEMAVVYVNLNQICLFSFQTHYTGYVASPSKCVPSYFLLLSFRHPPSVKYMSNYFYFHCSDVMNTLGSSRNVQSAFRRILRIIYTVSASLHEMGSNTNPLIIVRSGVLISLSPIISAKRN